MSKVGGGTEHHKQEEELPGLLSHTVMTEVQGPGEVETKEKILKEQKRVKRRNLNR